MSEQGNLSINSENMFPIIKKWLYSDHDIFVREVISNGCDAITKRKKLALMGECELPDDYEGRIDVAVNPNEKTMTFTDNGLGMTADEVREYINNIAFSGAKDFLEKYKDKATSDQIIGHFGLGFYSVFMVSGDVEIDTLSYQQGAEPVHWECDGGYSYTMDRGSRTQPGTTITLHLTDDCVEFANYYKAKETIQKYCSFMPYEIYLRDETTTDTETIKESERRPDDVVIEELPPEEKKEEKAADKPIENDDPNKADSAMDAEKKADGEEAGAEKPAPEKRYKIRRRPELLNDTHPLWTKTPKDCTDEEYKEFYRKTFHDYREPLFWIHLNMDYPFNLKGILYFPKINLEYENAEGVIKLYNNQVFVADNIKEVIPEYLMLLKGVIDCADFPLNVSRYFLQNDGYVRRISNHITKKVADRLTGMFKTERETYEGFWPDIHPFIKYGIMRDEKFAERMKDCVLYKTTDGKFLTLAEYKERNAEKLPDKMVYTSDPARQDAAIRLFTERGIDVAVLDHAIDVNFVSYMEYSGDPESKFKFCRVDAELESLTSSEEAPALDADKLTALMREAVGKDDLAVEVKPLTNDKVPVMLIEDEQVRRFNDMGRIYGRSEYTMPAKYNVVLNSRSATVQKLASREKDERSVLLAHQLYALAELSRQPLEAGQLTEFIRRSMEIVDLAAGME